MKLDFTNLSYDAKWHDFAKDCQLKIRIYPSSLTNVIIRDGDQMISGSDQRKAFIYCLQGWKDVTGADDKALPCTDAVKEKIFDFATVNPDFRAIVDFVIMKSILIQAEKEKQEKNS